MTRRGASLVGPLLLAATTASCTGPLPASRQTFFYGSPVVGRLVRAQPESKRDVQRVAAAIDSAAAQVKRCYRQPVVPSAGRTISTSLRIRLSADGSLSDIPTVVEQTGVTDGNRAFAGRMAEAASLAVMRCAPLRLPADLHDGGWDEIVLTFSPAMLV